MPFAQTRELIEDLFHGFFPMGPSLGIVAAEPKVLPHGEMRKEAAALQDVGKAPADDFVGRLVVDARAIELDGSGKQGA